MSSRTRSIQYFPRTGKTLSCRFCKEEGHEVKNCAKLANTQCRYCKNFGHTTRRCPAAAAKEQHRRSRARAARAAQFAPDEDGFSKPKSSFRRRVNKDSVMTLNILSNFTALADDVETKPAKKASVTIHRPSAAEARAVTGCWSKPLTVKEAAAASQEEKSPEAPKKTPKKTPKKARWADVADEEDSDSDDEDLFLGSR